MATAKKVSARARRGNPALRNRRWPKVLLVLGVLAALTAWYYRGTVMARAVAGTAYGARVACGCRYIEHRPLASCYKDFEPGMEVIRLADDPKTRTVTASVPLLTSRSVRFDSELGCQPEPFQR